MFHDQIYIDEIFTAHTRDFRARSNFISLQRKSRIDLNIKVQKFSLHIKQVTLRWSPDGIPTLTQWRDLHGRGIVRIPNGGSEATGRVSHAELVKPHRTQSY
jgi:hypothetical protein